MVQNGFWDEKKFQNFFFWGGGYKGKKFDFFFQPKTNFGPYGAIWDHTIFLDFFARFFSSLSTSFTVFEMAVCWLTNVLMFAHYAQKNFELSLSTS